MLRTVNGQEVNLSEDELVVSRLTDRIVVHTSEGAFTALVVSAGDQTLVSYRGGQYRIERTGKKKTSSSEAGDGKIKAPMPGAIVQVMVQSGEKVEKGTPLMVLEAMKTQQIIVAPFKGQVASVLTSPANQVAEGDLLVVLVPNDDQS